MPTYNSHTIQEVFNNVKNKIWVLPNFQRSFVWKVDDQKKLIASLILDYPIGSVLTLHATSELNKSKESAREIGKKTEFLAKPKEGFRYILDGQQRISTIYNAFDDIWNKKKDKWASEYEDFHYHLRYRFCLDFIQTETQKKEIDKKYIGEYIGWKIEKDIEYSINDDDDDDKTYPKDTKITEEVSKNILESEDLVNITIYKIFENEFLFGLKELDFDPKKDVEKHEVEYFIDFITEFQIWPKKDSEIPIHPKQRSDKDWQENLKNYCKKKSALPLYIMRTDLLKDILNDIGQARADKLSRFHQAEYLKIVKREGFTYHKNPKETNARLENNIVKFKLASRWADQVADYLKSMLNNSMPAIDEKRYAKAFEMFQIINETGTTLDDYDYLVLQYASLPNASNLTKCVSEILNAKINIPQSVYKTKNHFSAAQFGCEAGKQEITSNFKNRFKQLISINAHHKNGLQGNDVSSTDIRRHSIVRLEGKSIKNNLEITMRGLKRAYAFLNYRCGIIKIKDIPFELMVNAIAYVLQDDNNWKDEEKIDKIEYWYWSSIMSGWYSSNQNDRARKDIKILDDLLNGDSGTINKIKLDREDQIFKHSDHINKDILLNKLAANDTLSSSLHTAILQYILTKEPRDFIEAENLAAWKATTNQSGGNHIYEDHHIIPIASTKKTISQSSSEIRKDKTNIINSVLNRTYIMKKSNNTIKATDISKYIKDITTYALNNHLFTYISKSKNQGEDEWREQLMEGRFNRLETDILSELNSLIGR